MAFQKAKRFLRTWTKDETITAVGSGNGKSALFTGLQLFQAFLSLVSSAYMCEENIIRSFLWLKTFLSLASPLNLQGIVHLKSPILRKSCKFTADTKDRKNANLKTLPVVFQVVTFLSF